MLTTNVDHQFQLAGFEKKRLFYTQGDYGLWQCSKPCCQQTYDNEEAGAANGGGPTGYEASPLPSSPAAPTAANLMTMNLRCDDAFVEDSGWHQAAQPV